MIRFFTFLVLLIISFSCIETQSSRGSHPTESVTSESPVEVITDPNSIYSLFGEELPAKAFNSRDLRKKEADLALAKRKYEEDPENEEVIIWYGRRLGYLGRYQEAIRVYSLGIDKFEKSYRLLRHRGHRYITTRQFDKAIEDLEKAAFFSRPAKNAIEPDGIPNKINTPLGNDKFNIFYHLGIAYYLKGNFDKAISAFKQCLSFADNNDLKVACSDWFYMTYRKIGNVQAANELLHPITNKLVVIENKDYLNRLLVYKGVYQADVLLEYAERESGSLEATIGYGIGNYYLYNGNIERAKEIFTRILSGPSWDSFGYLAAEAELYNLNKL